MSPSHFARALWTCPQPSTRRPDPGQVLGASCAPRRKSQQAEREYEKIKSQLEGLEESVRDRCKKEFTGRGQGWAGRTQREEGERPGASPQPPRRPDDRDGGPD